VDRGGQPSGVRKTGLPERMRAGAVISEKHDKRRAQAGMFVVCLPTLN